MDKRRRKAKRLRLGLEERLGRMGIGEREARAAPVEAGFGDKEVVGEEEDGGGEDAKDGDC